MRRRVKGTVLGTTPKTTRTSALSWPTWAMVLPSLAMRAAGEIDVVAAGFEQVADHLGADLLGLFWGR